MFASLISRQAASVLRLEETGSLVRAIHRAATAKVKDEKLWIRLSERARVLLVHMDKAELVKVLCSFGHGGFQCKRFLRDLTPLLTRRISALTGAEISLCLNALRAVEHRDLALVQLLLTQTTMLEISAKDLSLVLNSAAYFRVHDASFWRTMSGRLPEISRHLTGQGLSLVVAALAKVDRRDQAVLPIMAQMIGNFNLNSTELAVAVSGFYRLDWPLPEISHLIRHEIGNFDHQAAVSVLHSVFALGKSCESEISHLLIARLRNAPLAQDQRRKFRETLEILGEDISDLPVPPVVQSDPPKWARSVISVLRSDMGITPLPSKEEFVFRSPEGVAVVCDFQGPFSFYAESRRLTAAAKLRQRLLRRRNLQLLAIPYFEWRELRDRDEKLAYLFTKGREAVRSIS